MSEITFISNKTRKETTKYIIVILSAVITWVLQVSIFSRFLFFDTTPSLGLLGSVYFGLTLGPFFGILFGTTLSFFTAGFLYDHIFYISYPLIGFLVGLFTKNIFSDERLFFILLCLLFTFPLELLNGWQFGLKNTASIMERYIIVSTSGSIINFTLAIFFYILMQFVTKKLKIR